MGDGHRVSDTQVRWNVKRGFRRARPEATKPREKVGTITQFEGLV